jgi:[acyl-carrier-protein] S-malonyltransferase
MGVLFSRGPALDQVAIKRLCLHVSQEGNGVIDQSAHLSPNSVLLLGQQDSVDRFQKAMRGILPGAQLRKKNLRLPPMHTSIIHQRAIAERAAVLLEKAPGGFVAPSPRLLSGVTGKASYNDFNSRELLYRWCDHPQQLWSMVHETLIAGVEAVVHVGPQPNIIPATFNRLTEDIRGQLRGYSPSRLGWKAVSHLARRPWLSQLLPTATALLRAPFLKHINLEDWLLEQKV